MTFIDCDDVYLLDGLVPIVEELKKRENLDVLMFDFKQTRLGETKEMQYRQNHSRTVSGIEFLKENELTYSACSYAFKRTFLLDKNLFFVENVQFEDGDWCMRVLMAAGRVKYLPVMAFHYMVMEGSTTSIDAGGKNIADVFESMVRWRNLYETAQGIDAELATQIKRRILRGAQVNSYRLVHVSSLRQKYGLLKKYYRGQYVGGSCWYVRCLSKFPLLSACAIHLLSPLLKMYLRRKHSM